MEPVRRVRRLAWIAIALAVVALPLFFVPDGEGYGHVAWSVAGALVLHPAAFAGIGALVKYRELDEAERANARVALVALPSVVLGAIVVGLTWTAP